MKYALLAALLYALSSPISKLLLEFVGPTLMAACLYLGAGFGLLLVKKTKKTKEEKLEKKDMPYVVGMVVLDIIAPILLMMGLTITSSSNAALLNNFEIVATTVIAYFIFKEKISKNLLIGIILVLISSIILTFDISSLSFNLGSVLVLLAAIAWGFENNCTKMISNKNPIDIVIIKGIFSGLGSLIISIIINEFTLNYYLIFALILGFFSYGLSITTYIYAQRHLGASKTSAFYAVNPFIGTLLSLIIFKDMPNFNFVIALVIMMVATIFIVKEE
jgi:drug/metabolite transporter (DMT)-like permease